MDRWLKLVVAGIFVFGVCAMLAHRAARSVSATQPSNASMPLAGSPEAGTGSGVPQPTTIDIPVGRKPSPAATAPADEPATQDLPERTASSLDHAPDSTTTTAPIYPYGYVPDDQASSPDTAVSSPPVETASQRVGEHFRRH